MKNIVIISIALFFSLIACAQSTSKVTLRNGTEILGTIKSIDPSDAVIIVISGIETTIQMSDIAKIEENHQASSTLPVLSPEDKLTVTDFADYPESFMLKIGNENIKMILVRGGDMNMGFEGRHSRRYNSEPLHLVKVTSFYISETYVSNAIANYLKGKKPKKGYYDTTSWEKSDELIRLIANISGVPVRLPTEAEWEYASCSPVQNLIFSECKEAEYCFDYFGNYDNKNGSIDPQGPQNGSNHVCRTYAFGTYPESCKFERFKSPIIGHTYLRLAVKAKDVNITQKKIGWTGD